MKISVIFNPTAGRRRWEFVNAVMTELKVKGAKVSLVSTRGPGDAEMLAQEHAQGDTDIVVAAGGDGTINEVANGLIASGRGTLGLIPMGTANLVALEIGLRTSPVEVARTLLTGTPQQVHAGIANGRHFLLMAGVGFDAQVVAGLNIGLKKRIGKAAYAWSSMVQMNRFAFPTYQVTADGQSYEAASVIVCKSRYYAGPYTLAPSARLTEPHLELCLFKRRGKLSVMRYGLIMLLDRFETCPDIEHVVCEKVHIHAPADGQGLIQADGEMFGEAPVEIGIAPNALQLIYPTANQSR